MASKKTSESRDEFGNKVSMPRKVTGAQSIRATGKDKTTGSRSGSSLRARGVEKGSPRSVTATGGQSLRAAGAESKRSKKMDTQPSSARAAGAKAKAAAMKTPPRSARAAGAEKVKPSSYPQSVRAAGAKAKANDTQPSSFRAQRFGKGKVGASAPAGRNKTQSIRAAEYKKKNPGKY